MEPNDNNPHHHHHHHHHFTSPLTPYFPQPPTATTTTATTTTTTSATPPSPTNGLLPPNPSTTDAPSESHHMVYPSHSVGPSVTVEPAKRKRGRPRKYGTPEQALAAKKSTAASSRADKRVGEEHSSSSTSPTSYLPSSSKKSQQLASLSSVGQGFTPHVITVTAGEVPLGVTVTGDRNFGCISESTCHSSFLTNIDAQQDVGQKIMMFLQQSRREMCILSASGTISNASLRQAATSGGTIAYEGWFEIISLSGSYIHTDIGGRTGGLSVCLSSSDGQIIGGGVGGPLKAAGPVQVIVGSFVFDNKKEKGDASASKLPSPVGATTVPNFGFRSPVESSMRNDDHLNIGGSSFMPQPRGMHMSSPRPTDWRTSPDAQANMGYDLTGRAGYGTYQSPENGDYEQLPD